MAVMRPWCRVSALLAAVAALLLDSCGDPGGGPSIPPSPPASILSPTPSPTPRVTPTTTPADKAKGAVVRFWSVVDELAADPDKSLNALHDVARDRMFDQWTFNIREYRYKQLRQVGHVKVGNATVMAANGTDRNRVSVCLDASKTDLLD